MPTVGSLAPLAPGRSRGISGCRWQQRRSILRHSTPAGCPEPREHHGDSTSAGSFEGATARPLRVLVVSVAAILQVGVAVPFTVGLGLLAPLWGILTGWALWLASAAALVRTARRAPLLAPIVPIVNAGLLWLLVAAGGAWFGWTA